MGIFFHAGERSAYVVEQGNSGLRRVSVGDLKFTVATSAAPAGTAPRSKVGPIALAAAAAAWLACRQGGARAPRGVGRTAWHVLFMPVSTVHRQRHGVYT